MLYSVSGGVRVGVRLFRDLMGTSNVLSAAELLQLVEALLIILILPLKFD